ncbi:CU044_2847 family protein [Actinacidiphila bryophytorum]|uniref:CU044_2847 family protein n=1 Tax=Actinacidiphila bryophytorum TaxID=1436133 RepID=UPI002176A69B|nr:CU044_2847 family protein [Actinacidiphila bryophytorum]UWE10414.1 hypothetical protein NYE86_17940 [Actinacidiphila bryophytorum]
MRFVDFAFDDGTSVLVQVSPGPGDGGGEWEDDTAVGPVGVGSGAVRRVGHELERAFAPLVPVLEGIRGQARRMQDAPDELSVQFGVQFTSGLKLAVVGSVEATFTVTATWRGETPQAGAGDDGAGG